VTTHTGAPYSPNGAPVGQLTVVSEPPHRAEPGAQNAGLSAHGEGHFMDHPGKAGGIDLEADYFEKNAERMRYPEFRRQHLSVGSGVIHAAWLTSEKTVIVTGSSR